MTVGVGLGVVVPGKTNKFLKSNSIKLQTEQFMCILWDSEWNIYSNSDQL